MANFASSYIPTTSAAATRAADAASMSGTNFSEWHRQDEGTFVCEFDAPAIPQDSSAFRRVLSINDGSSANRADLLINAGWLDDRIGVSVSSQGVDQFDSTSATGGWIHTPVSPWATNAYAYKQDDFATVWNGGQVAVGSTGSVPSVNRLDIANYLSVDQLNGRIRRIAYYPVKFSSSQLQALTA